MMLSELPQIKIKVLNFVRGNGGFTPDRVSQVLSIPLNIIHQAVAELKKEGLLQSGPTLKIGRRIG